MIRTLRPAVVLALGILVAACGGGGPSLPGSSPAPLPGPPGDLDFVITDLNEALLTWAAPVPEPGRAPVTGYEVYLEGQARPVGVTGSLSYLYRGLVPGRTYVFHVRAVSRVGRSQAAGSATVTVTAVPILAPGPPGLLVVELTPNNEAFLQWTAPPPLPGRAPATGYVIYRDLPDGNVERLGTSDSLTYTRPGLSPGVRYVFHVRASSAAGLSQPSASVPLDVPRGPVLAPNPPGNLVAELTSDRDVLLTWSAPAASPDRSPVTGYRVFLETLNGESEELQETLSLSYRHPIPDVPTRRRHVFYVRALSTAGPSQPSGSASVDVPPVSIQVPEPPGNFTAVLTSHNDALLQWTAPAPSPNRAPFTHFEVYRELPGGLIPQKLGESRSLSYLHPGLEWGERYVFHVLAVSDVGSGRPSRSTFLDVPLDPTAMLPPDAPGSFTAMLTPDNDVQFEWTVPSPAGNRAPVEGYLVYEVRPGLSPRILNPDSNDAGPDPDPVDALTYLHDPDPPLVPGQLYTYYVRATSAEGTSPPSASDNVEVPFDPLVPLSIPHVTVRADQSGSDYKEVTVSWVHNLLPALQSLVTGFELQYCEVAPNHSTDHCPANDWMDISGTFGPRDRIHTELVTCDDSNISPMDKARMYRVRALASNNSLSSRYSVPTRPICPGADYSPPRRVDAIFAAPAIPEPMRVNICWELPEDNNSPLLGYELQATTGPDLPATEDGWVIVDAHIDPTADPVCRLYSGVVANQIYWFRVRAYNLSGHGHWSAPYHYRHGTEFVPPLPSRASVQTRQAILSRRRRARLSENVERGARVRSNARPPGIRAGDGGLRHGGRNRDSGRRLPTPPPALSSWRQARHRRSIEVTVHADTEDEGEETLTLSLSNAVGARIEDGEATGTIQDRDPLPQAWLARFGRTVAGQVVDAVGTRLESEAEHARPGGRHVARIIRLRRRPWRH